LYPSDTLDRRKKKNPKLYGEITENQYSLSNTINLDITKLTDKHISECTKDSTFPSLVTIEQQIT